eukprot:Hpha_TRINITY_DN15109_c2_g2::TRINITY_DN15109_c2_g2_i1::g.130214::m.130214
MRGVILVAVLNVVSAQWCEPFSNPTSDISLSTWHTVSISKTEGWFIGVRPENGNVKGALANGFQGSEAANDWLISPRLVAGPAARITFNVYHKFHGSPALKMVISTNYSGGPNPAAAGWDEIDIEASLSEDSNDRWLEQQQDLSAYAGKSIHIGFWYRSQGVIGGEAAIQGVQNVCLLDLSRALPVVCEAFSDPTGDIGLSSFTAVNIAGDTDWIIIERPRDSGIKGAFANGFGADAPSDDWLISPTFVVARSDATLFAEVYREYSGSPPLQVRISSDYRGGNPDSAVWTIHDIPATVDGPSRTWIPVSFPLGKYLSEGAMTVAFRYQSVGSKAGEASRHGVTNICVSGGRVQRDQVCENFEQTQLGIEASLYTSVSLAGDGGWAIAEGGGSNGAFTNGYDAGDASDNWLISPWLELRKDPIVSFLVYWRFDGSPPLELKVSTDYIFTGVISQANWETIVIEESLSDPAKNAWLLVSRSLQGYAGKRVHVAFRYQSVGQKSGEASRMGIDRICIKSMRVVHTPPCENFDLVQADLGKTQYSAESVSGNTKWGIEERGGSFGVVANGFGADAISDDWLISPRMMGAPGAHASFSVYWKFSGSPAMQFASSLDYGGQGSPVGSTWAETAIPETLDAAAEDTWTPVSKDLTEVDGKDFVFAFRYQTVGTGGGEASRQGVDNVCVRGVELGLCEHFKNAIMDLTLTSYTQYSVSSSATWYIDEEEGRAAVIGNGFNADVASDDWLISPAVVVVSDSATVSLDLFHKYGGSPPLELKISRNYPGKGTPGAANWETVILEESTADVSNRKWVRATRGLGGHLGYVVHIAVRYQSVGTAGGEATLMGVSDICLYGVELEAGQLAESVIPPPPDPPPLCDGCVRLLLQYRTEMQAIDRDNIPCSDLRIASCTGGVVPSLAWIRHWTVPGRTLTAFGVDARSRFVLFHPMGMMVNAVAETLYNASFAVLNEPHMITQDSTRDQALEFISKSLEAGAGVLVTNVALENLKFQVFAGLLVREHVATVGGRRVGFMTLFGSATFVPVIDSDVAIPAATRRLREVKKCDTVVIIGTRYAFPHHTETESLSAYDIDIVIPFQCSSDECPPPGSPYKKNNTWFLPRTEDMTAILHIDIPPPGGNASIGWAFTYTPDEPPPKAFMASPEWGADLRMMQSLVDEANAANPVVGYSTAPMPSGELGAGRGGLAEGPRIDPCRREECPPGNLAADAVREAMLVAGPTIINGGAAQDG